MPNLNIIRLYSKFDKLFVDSRLLIVLIADTRHFCIWVLKTLKLYYGVNLRKNFQSVSADHVQLLPSITLYVHVYMCNNVSGPTFRV